MKMSWYNQRFLPRTGSEHVALIGNNFIGLIHAYLVLLLGTAEL